MISLLVYDVLCHLIECGLQGGHIHAARRDPTAQSSVWLSLTSGT